MSGGVRIVEVAPDDLERLRILWLGVHAHHQATSPELGPYVSDSTTWAVRRPVYDEALAAGGFAFVAIDGGRDVGYALVRRDAPPWPATFVTASTVAELETLAVAPEARGRGVGSRLLDAVDARLDAEGLDDRLVGALAANARAIALYERRGYVPTWLTVTRFGATPPVATPSVATEPVAPDEVDALEPLWLALHHHHQSVAPQLGPFVPDAESWAVAGAQLRDAAESEVLLRTGSASAPTAFAWAGVLVDDPLWADTWAVGSRVAELHMLAVAPEQRGRGLGTALLDAVDGILVREGVRDQVVGAIAPNARAIELYRRRGFRPTWLGLTRHAARPAA